jgi:hypothetical protein
MPSITAPGVWTVTISSTSNGPLEYTDGSNTQYVGAASSLIFDATTAAAPEPAAAALALLGGVVILVARRKSFAGT